MAQTETVQRSVVPIYLVGLTWVTYAILFPLYTPLHCVICAIVSALVYLAGRAIFPDKAAQGSAPSGHAQAQSQAAQGTAASSQPAAPAVSPEVKALLEERDKALSEMRRLNDAIADPKISAQIDHLEHVTAKITGIVAREPSKLPQISRFMDYYLPTTLKILNAYDRAGSVGIEGSNITATKEKVEAMMDKIVIAFDRTLDSLFSDEAMDISTDITVMENLLAQEGLSGTDQPGDGGITLSL